MKGKRLFTRAGRPAFAAALSLMLAMTVCAASVWAAGPADRPDETSYEIQTAAGENGNTGVVMLGKILTSSQPDTFPAITDFVYTIEAVEAWDNANVSTALSGEEIAAGSMPMPQTSSAPHQQVTVAGTKATVLVGNFQDKSAANHSTGDGEDSRTMRTRTTPVSIAFSKAGYYVYKVREVGSIPEKAPENAASAPVRTVPGVDYDDNEYFMVFYVCNKVDEDGNTIDGVYVHSITSYTNESGDSSYRPDLSDIQNVTDNGGAQAKANTGQVNADGTVTHNLGKVGVSPPDAPNRLEAYRMWNAYVSHDLVLQKNVTGNLGDRTKLFEFTISLSGLGKNAVYVTDAAAEETGQESTVEIVSASVGTKNSGTSFTASDDGEASLLVRMKDDDSFVIHGLPMTAQYSIREAASDHVARYEIRSSNESDASAEENAAIIAKAADSNGTKSDQSLETALESVDKFDGTVTVQFTNNRDLAAITGVPGLDKMVTIGLALLMALAAVSMVRGRRRFSAEDEIDLQKFDTE